MKPTSLSALIGRGSYGSALSGWGSGHVGSLPPFTRVGTRQEKGTTQRFCQVELERWGSEKELLSEDSALGSEGPSRQRVDSESLLDWI